VKQVAWRVTATVSRGRGESRESLGVQTRDRDDEAAKSRFADVAADLGWDVQEIHSVTLVTEGSSR
jgi:hypothetical protein